MRTVRTIAEARAALDALPAPVGLVPTMGALHDGHRSLLARAREECATVVMSLLSVLSATVFVPARSSASGTASASVRHTKVLPSGNGQACVCQAPPLSW